MEIVSCGWWPANAIADIRTAIEMLQQKGYNRTDFTVVAPKNIMIELWKTSGTQFFTYLNLLEMTKVISGVITSDLIPDDECLVYATDTNMPFFVECNGIWVVKQDSIVKILKVNNP